MATATIVIEDEGESIACKVTWSGGFDKTSKAHQAAQILIKKMDEHFENQGPAPERVIEQPGLVLIEGGHASKA
jgi:hypothetical protein